MRCDAPGDKGQQIRIQNCQYLGFVSYFPCCRTTKYDTQAVDSLLVHPKLFPGAEGKSDTAWAISLSRPLSLTLARLAHKIS